VQRSGLAMRWDGELSNMRYQREEGDERTGDVTRNSSNAQLPVDI